MKFPLFTFITLTHSIISLHLFTSQLFFLHLRRENNQSFMDNIGDWLYIVFLAIAGISGLFSSKEKKKKKGRPEILGQPDKEIVSDEQPQPAEDKGFWEIGEEIKQAPAQPTPEPEEKPRPIQEDKPRKAPPTVPPMKEPERPTPEITLQDTDELRKAVIYAEILNRKY